MLGRQKSRVLLIATLIQTTVAAQDNPQVENDAAPTVLGEIVVTGILPGPPLWKVSNGDRALWILPLVNLYPKGMHWESGRVEALVAASQEYIAMPFATHITTTANPFTIMRLKGVHDETTRLQDGKKLSEILPPDLKRRYVKLKDRYFPNDKKIERLTAREAGKRMQQRILEVENLEQLSYANLSSPEVIMDSLYKWLKRNKTIRRTNTSYVIADKLKFSDAKAWGDEVAAKMNSAGHREFEIACLASKIAYFENDLELAKKRANAWARGDTDELLRHASSVNADLALQSIRGPCRNPSNPDDAVAMEAISDEKWLAAAEAALSNNETTFGVLGLDAIVSSDGLIAKLQARGYRIEVPR